MSAATTAVGAGLLIGGTGLAAFGPQGTTDCQPVAGTPPQVECTTSTAPTQIVGVGVAALGAVLMFAGVGERRPGQARTRRRR